MRYRTNFTADGSINNHMKYHTLSVCSIVDLRIGGRWFDPQLGQYSFRCPCFENGYVGKQPVAWKEYCGEYWLNKNSRKAWIGALATAI